MPLALFLAMSANAAEKQLSSPDGKLVVTVSDVGGKPSYSIHYNGVEFLKPSPLGLNTNIGDFTGEMVLSENAPVETVSKSYEMQTIKKSRIDYRANRAVFNFSQNDRAVFDVIFQVSDNDVAFRYKLYPRRQTLSCIVKEEATGFVFPEGTTTFLCPQMRPMGGFARTTPSYETTYTADDAMGKNAGGLGYTFPCLFRNGDKGWVLISETGVNSLYCGSRLLGGAENLYKITFPLPTENNGNGTVEPALSLPGETPWRTITIGETLKPIVETTIPFDVVEPLYEASKDYTYGRGSWSWIIGGDQSISYDETKRYIDFSHAMTWESVLIDAYWDREIGRDRIAELARYAAGKDVGLFLWYNTNGYWNDAPQTPRNIMSNTIARRREMKWMQSAGIRGIKVDFFGGDKQVTMQLYEDILSDANDFGLMVIFHGCTLPRGWERMYPNFVSSEAVLASEMLHFSQDVCEAEAYNATMLPFIRNAVASMDFGGSTLNKYYNPSNSSAQGGGVRRTSDVFALSTAVLFQSSAQHFAMAPNNLEDAPAWALDFMKKVPSTWDEVRFIDGYPGKYVIMARRHGDKWYIAGINAQKETLNLTITLPMFSAGEEVSFYSDTDKLEGSLKSVKLNRKQELQISIPCNGGIVVVK